MPGVFEALQRKLFNLAGNNKSLFIGKLGKETDLDIRELAFQQGEPAYQLIRQVLAGQAAIPLCAATDARDPQVAALGKSLRKIDRKARFLTEERGTQDLYLGYPFVEGCLEEGVPIRAPLLFFPARLAVRENQWVLVRQKEQTPFINKFFLLAYAHYLKTALPEELWNEDFLDFDPDATVFRTQLYRFFEESKLGVHFNQDLFADELLPVGPATKEEILAKYKPGQLKLQPHAVLGIFALSDLFLINDYDALASEYERIEDVFPAIPAARAGLKEENFLTCLPIDGPQEHCLKQALMGASLVIQGPPGTGKSQFIANLATNLMAQGKKVLVVCQKRAALDVVFERLNELGIGHFVSLVHDYRQQQREIYDQLASQISRLPDYQKEVGSLNAVIIEREFLQHCRKLDGLAAAAEAYHQALPDTSQHGISLSELYEMATPISNAPVAEARPFQYLDLEPLENSFHTYFKLWLQAGKLQSPGIDKRLGWEAADPQDLKKWFESLQNARSFLESKDQLPQPVVIVAQNPHLVAVSQWIDELFQAEMAGQVKSKTLQQQYEVIHIVTQLISTLPTTVSLEWQVFLRHKSQHWHQVNEATTARLSAKGLSSWFFGFTAHGKLLKTSLQMVGMQPSQTADFQTRLQRNLTLAQVKLQIDSLLSVPISHQELETLVARLQIHGLAWQHALQLVLEKPGAKSTEALWQLQVGNPKLYLESVEAVTSLTDCFEGGIPATVWKKSEDWNALVEFVERFAIQVSAFDALAVKLNPQARTLFQASAFQINEDDTEHPIDAFRNLIYNAWIVNLEQFAGFADYSALANLTVLSEDIVACIEGKMPVSQRLLHLQLFQLPIKDLEFNRLNNRLTYRGLEHEVTKKRRIWPLRKLMHQFAEEVFRLLPCWLSSPEAASAIFPLERIFDAVIFDEASQCYAEKAIPVFARANQVVVIGDSKQLPPNTLYRVVWDEAPDTEYAPETEVDAALDLARFHLPEYALTWHYRCQTPELIAFSNRHFYQEKLVVLPNHSFINEKAQVFDYKLIDGVWLNQTNKAEAGYILEEAKRWLANSQEEKTVGVVTFNQPQQELILDELTAFFADQNMAWPSWLWVKNIENVQGDEADHIYFSLAYGPDEQGKVRANFGSLSMAGGEKRLNVAVTRAREKVVMVASIKPHQLEVEQSLNAGPKLLKQYLEYVWEQALKPTQTGFSTTSIELKDTVVIDSYMDGKTSFGHYSLLQKRRGWQTNWRFSRQSFVEKFQANS